MKSEFPILEHDARWRLTRKMQSSRDEEVRLLIAEGKSITGAFVIGSVLAISTGLLELFLFPIQYGIDRRVRKNTNT